MLNFQMSIDINDDNDDYVITYNAIEASSWCGLACCYFLNNNTLLAQHCLCRCIQIDKTLPDAWTNLALIYIHHYYNNQTNAKKDYSSPLMNDANKVLDTLTQIADIPFIWIGRGLLLEMEVKINSDDVDMYHNNNKAAADAYRAALQASRHPLALIGLSACTSRSKSYFNENNNNSIIDNSNDGVSSRESCDSMIMCLYSTAGGCNATFDQFFSRVMLFEDQMKKHISWYHSEQFHNNAVKSDNPLLNGHIPINDVPQWILEKSSLACNRDDTEISLAQVTNNVNYSSDLVQLGESNQPIDHQDISNSNDSSDMHSTKDWEHWFNISKELIQEATHLMNQDETSN